MKKNKIRLQKKRGKKIFLSSITKKDLGTLFKWVNDDSLVTFSTWYRPVHWSEHLKWWQSIFKDKNTFVFGIRLIKSKKIIGVCKLTGIHWTYRNAELRIKIGDTKYLSKGYGTEAIQLLLKYAWDNLNLERVYCFVFEDNKRAIRAYAKAGFAIEGVMQKAAYINNIYKNIVIMGILRKNN